MSSVAPKDHREAIEKGARLGYLARALVFLVIGYFAFRSAFAGGQALSEEDAIRELVGSPFGMVMLVLLVVALPAFALWRYVQAFFDADGYGRDAKGIATRIGRFFSGCVYLFLAIYAGSLLFGFSTRDSGGGGVLEAWAPLFGPWFTVPAGLVMLAVAGAHVKRAWTGEFLKFLSLPPAHEGWMTALCRVGIVARAVVFATIAFLFFTSAWRWTPEDTPGVQDALTEIGQWPLGWLLLSLTGAGLMAFGGYCLALARYGHVRSPDLDPSKAMAAMRG
ncbi:DUF1206 domain-containing protein [Aureimonas populi]|uniref:DUF1206 domain-containing protein n=1 Tax=Aureimonas populi TaxID=1701758 RepID=A0ABW5CKY2_9HYPH|nr:DUF1206 domain-containing protein [Aureimonas populi]